jgi:hypothetical protein
VSNYSFRLSPILWPVAGSISAILLAMLAMLNILNYTVTVSESSLNQAIQDEFPKNLPTGVLKEPELHLVNAKIAICVNYEPLEPQELINGQMVRLCAQGQAFWSDEDAAVYVRNFELLSIRGGGLGNKTSKPLQEFLSEFVFAELGAVKVYESKQMIGSQVDSVSIVDKTLKIKL